MVIQNWSKEITVVELGDDPQFTDEMGDLMDSLENNPTNVVLNFVAVGFINSSNVARLLRLRKMSMSAKKRLLFCDVNTQVWGVFLVTGLDKIFDFTDDVSTALAKLQIAAAQQ